MYFLVKPLGMCRWMGLYFHNLIDYNGVTFFVEFLEWGRTLIFWDFWDKKLLESRDLQIGRFMVKKYFLLLF